MEETIFNLVDTVTQFGGAYGPYIVVIGVLLASGLGLPLPEDIPLLVGGMLCHMEQASLWVMIPATFVAVVGADFMVYCLGRRYGHHVPKLPLVRHYLSQKRLAQAEQAFHGHGGKTLFTSRFVPGLRTAVFFTAGVFKIPAWKMLLFDGLAALLSVPTLVLIGFFGAKQFEKVKEWAAIGELAMAGLIILTLAGLLGWHYLRKRKRERKAAADLAKPAAPPTAPSASSQRPSAAAPVTPPRRVISRG